MITVLIFIFIVLFGLITSYEDIKEGKIRNKWILSAIIFGTVVYVVDVFFMHSYLNYTPYFFPSAFEFWINIFSTVIVALLIWHSGLWSAGDGKLFIAYSFLVPLRYYFTGYTLHFPAITLLINTFVPFLIVMFFYLVFKADFRTHLSVLKFAFSPKILFTIILFVFSFEWIIAMFFRMIGIYPNLFFIVLFLFIIIMFATKYLGMNFFVLVGVLSAARLIFDFGVITNIHFLTNLLVTSLILIFFRFYLLTLAYYVFSYPVYIENLKEGMLPAEDIIQVSKNKFIKKKHLQRSFIQALISRTNEHSILKSLPDGLTKEEIAFIQQLHSRGFLKDHTLNIYREFPFAPFMFIGVLITLIAGGNIVLVLLHFI